MTTTGGVTVIENLDLGDLVTLETLSLDGYLTDINICYQYLLSVLISKIEANNKLRCILKREFIRLNECLGILLAKILINQFFSRYGQISINF